MTEKLQELREQVQHDREIAADLMEMLAERGGNVPGMDPEYQALAYGMQAQMHSIEVAIHTQTEVLLELFGGSRQ